MIERAIGLILKGDASIRRFLKDDRDFYSVFVPQAAPLPALAFTVDGDVRAYSNDGESGQVSQDLEVECWADDAEELAGLVDAVRLAFNGAGRKSFGTIAIAFLKYETSVRDAELVSRSGREQRHTRTMEYTVFYQEHVE